MYQMESFLFHLCQDDRRQAAPRRLLLERILNLFSHGPGGCSGIVCIPNGPTNDQVIGTAPNGQGRGNHTGLVVGSNTEPNWPYAGGYRQKRVAKFPFDRLNFVAGADDSGTASIPCHGSLF
jgi:hypothetical protein